MFGLSTDLQRGSPAGSRASSAASAVALAAAMLVSAVSPSMSQSLQQALTQTYRTNPQLDAARATLRAQDEEIARANSGYRPTVSGTADAAWQRTDSEPRTATTGELHPRGYGVNLAQPIFRGFRTLSQVRVAEANVRAGRETLRNTEQTVLLLAATAYMDVVRDQTIVRLNENNVNVLTNQLKATQDQFAVGEVTRTDVAQAEARRAGSIANLEVARGNLKASRAVYERVVGSPPGALIEPREPVKLMPKSLDEALQIAQRENPLIVNALYLEQAARYTIDQIRGELLPSLTLNAAYAKRYDPSRTIDEQDTRTVTANMTVPLYTGGEVEARVRQAKHTHVSRLQTVEQIRTEQQALVVAAWSRYLAAKAQGVATGTQVKANQTALTGVREEYRVGQRTLLDVLNAEQELLNAQSNEVSARRDAIVQAYTLLQTVGRFTAQEFALGNEIYDPEVHYFEVRRKWFGLSITYADGRRETLDASLEHAPAK